MSAPEAIAELSRGALVGHKQTSVFTAAETFGWQLRSISGRSFPVSQRRVIGHCRHWGGSGSTSAMSWTADSGGIEQSNGSFLHQRTHTPDPQRPSRSLYTGRSQPLDIAACGLRS
jgi:hypothetical protein